MVLSGEGEIMPCRVWPVNSVKVRLLPRSGCVWPSSSMAVTGGCSLAETGNRRSLAQEMSRRGAGDSVGNTGLKNGISDAQKSERR